jgi:hypothetical protein
LKVELAGDLVKLHNDLRADYRKRQKEIQKVNKLASEAPNPFNEILNKFFTSELGSRLHRAFFIPASRSFFANLQRSVFFFLAQNIKIDPFIWQFGHHYETAKRTFAERSVPDHKTDLGKLRKKIDPLLDAILVGKYKYEDEQDWIEDKKSTKTNLSDASSGQQEALPMLAMLATWPFALYPARFTLFIEEPEAHLFPTSQKHVVSLLALISNRLSCDFVITTHSPYILTAINNLILASEVGSEKGSYEVGRVVDKDFFVRYEDVRAYTIADGRLESILNDETRLVGTNIIDSVSNEFDEVFDTLLSMQMKGDR